MPSNHLIPIRPTRDPAVAGSLCRVGQCGMTRRKDLPVIARLDAGQIFFARNGSPPVQFDGPTPAVPARERPSTEVAHEECLEMSGSNCLAGFGSSALSSI